MVTVVPPAHFRGRRLDILLNGSSGSGIAQRQCLGAPGRNGENEHCANRGKPKNFRHLHI
jgi:hypothetical protein